MSEFSNPPRYSAETAREYVAAIIGVLGDRDPVTVLEATPRELRDAVAGITDSAARTPERPGKWSVQQVVRHLADSELVYGYRMRLIVAADTPAIPGYDQDAWAELLGYHDGTLAEALEDHAAMRAMNLRWLRARSPAELARTGLHAERGPESVIHIARLLAGHDLVHLRQVRRIREVVG